MRDRQKLTRKEEDILSYLVEYTKKDHYQPSLAEMAVVFGPNVKRYMRNIARKGWVLMTGHPRAIVIPRDVWDAYPSRGDQ